MDDNDRTVVEAPMFLEPSDVELDGSDGSVDVDLGDLHQTVPRGCENVWRYIDALLYGVEAAEFDNHWRGCMVCCLAVRQAERARQP